MRAPKKAIFESHLPDADEPPFCSAQALIATTADSATGTTSHARVTLTFTFCSASLKTRAHWFRGAGTRRT
ncbi:hypothetical protein Asera_49420 [Actinocatenispora sera]|uniref:Uncharacterized protein n=1 Tax=Actinocatenispora sera TaxID=390989 RepID=A0A810L5Q8_9ACTN|nr:hypothetical protein Asera_49420 [Actinocatenispora sera]